METYKQNGFSVNIEHDDSCYFYDDLWQGVSFISNHRDYVCEGELSHFTLEHVMNNELPDDIVAIPVRAYIHGRIALTVSDTGYPFNCRFDSGTFGYLLFKTGEFGKDNIGLEGFVKHWQAVLNGDIYYFVIEKNGEVIDSCGGFDDIDYMKEEITSIINNTIKYEKLEKIKRLKAMIKNRVPLHRRVEWKE